jgi:cytochrome c-type biogenesis protein
MTELLPAILTALWFGILTSISPCPLAGNIAAVSYIGQRLDSPRKVILTGLLYTLGRTIVYLLLGILLVYSLLSMPDASFFLQRYMNKLLGPLLIIVGMFLLELLTLTPRGMGMSDKLQQHIDSWGMWGALPLGMIFALAFCPISAALFFGSLLPLALQAESAVLLPSFYGIGTALPVLLFAILFGLGAGAVGKAFNKLTLFERYARSITGIIFILVGIYYCLDSIFGII